MKIFITFSNVIIAIYFFLLANFYFWFSAFAMFVIAFRSQMFQNPLTYFYDMLFQFFLAFFIIYGSVMFFRKTEKKYSYGLVVLFLALIEKLIFFSFLFTKGDLKMASLQYMVMLGVPFFYIFLLKRLSQKIANNQAVV